MRKHLNTRTAIKSVGLFADCLLFSGLLLLPLNPFVRFAEHPVICVLLLLGVCGIVLSVRIESNHKDKKREAEKQLKQKLTDRLLLKNDEAISDMLGKQRFILVRKQEPDRFDVLDAIRKGADAIGVFSKKKEHVTLLAAYAPNTELYDADELLSVIAPESQNTTKVTRSVRLNKYFLLGVIWMALSFVLKNKIYFRLISCACLIIAPITGALRSSAMRKKILLFLDKRKD